MGFLTRDCLVNEVEFISSVKYAELLQHKRGTQS